jgi:HsdM N-terminal domain
MITGELKSKVDKLWTTFWSNGVSNPLSVIEQISYLLFIKRLDDLELAKEKQVKRLGGKVKDPTFTTEQQECRWSQFKNQNAEGMLKIVRDKAFPFIDPLKDVDRGQQAFFVSKESIVENGYDLSINRYKEVEYAEVVYESPKVILGKLKVLEDEIRSDLDELEGML